MKKGGIKTPREQKESLFTCFKAFAHGQGLMSLVFTLEVNMVMTWCSYLTSYYSLGFGTSFFQKKKKGSVIGLQQCTALEPMMWL